MSKKQMSMFMLGKCDNGDTAMVVGITKEGWNYMRTGKTHNFDLTKAGVPFKLVLFGCDNIKEAEKIIFDGAAAQGIQIEDQRGKDFNV